MTQIKKKLDKMYSVISFIEAFNTKNKKRRREGEIIHNFNESLIQSYLLDAWKYLKVNQNNLPFYLKNALKDVEFAYMSEDTEKLKLSLERLLLELRNFQHFEQRDDFSPCSNSS
jgi:hypothetical protein